MIFGRFNSRKERQKTTCEKNFTSYPKWHSKRFPIIDLKITTGYSIFQFIKSLASPTNRKIATRRDLETIENAEGRGHPRYFDHTPNKTRS